MDKDTTIGRRPGGAERPHESGVAAPGRGGRMSRQRKTAAVLRLLRGEDLEEVSRSLGVTAATAFVRAPEGNGCAERFIRTFEENLLWVRHFETIEELRQALLAFREVYNTTWLIERHGFINPAALRRKQLQPVARAA